MFQAKWYSDIISSSIFMSITPALEKFSFLYENEMDEIVQVFELEFYNTLFMHSIKTN